jgi:hypothetical protein
MGQNASGTDMLRAPFAKALQEVQGAGPDGLPRIAEYFQHGTQLYCRYADGMLAVAHYQSGVIIGWRAVPTPSYADLFTRTESRETMPDAPRVGIWTTATLSDARPVWRCGCERGNDLNQSYAEKCADCNVVRPPRADD